MPNWACEFDSHLGHLIRAEVVENQRLPLFLGQNCTEIAPVQKFPSPISAPINTYLRNCTDSLLYDDISLEKSSLHPIPQYHIPKKNCTFATANEAIMPHITAVWKNGPEAFAKPRLGLRHAGRVGC